MADGQQAFGFQPLPVSRLRPGEIVVDLFAGGGGASTALEQALQRSVDIAINHDRFAVGMHAANHPLTRHRREDIWQADPRALCAGRRVGWLHASPDCTHFSQAKGGQPRSRATRSLSWVIPKWAGSVQPRIISMENVKQIAKWGPLVAKRDPATGRVVRLDGAVAAVGERTPLESQFLIPDKRREGKTWRAFQRHMRSLGYRFDYRLLKACDYGAGTSRERLFGIGRCDGKPIVWPVPTHGTGLIPYVTAADCLDWTIPCPSIFARKKPLADATCRRIARGIKRYVIDASEPFFITEHANASRQACWSASEPLRTQCAQVKGGHFALVAATLVQTGYGERAGQAPRALDLQQPLGTIVGGASKHALVTAFLEQANSGGPNGKPARAHAATEPVSAITGSGSQQRLVTAHLVTMRHFAHGQRVDDPLGTVCSGTVHHGTVECTVVAATHAEPADTNNTLGSPDDLNLPPDAEADALRVAAFLVNYYGNGQPLDVRDPVGTVTTRDRLALVTVTIRGTPYVIVDIGLRMLKPRELYRAQGFPPDYIIERTADGTPLTITQQVRMVGNSVSPQPLCAIAVANLDEFVLAEAV